MHPRRYHLLLGGLFLSVVLLSAPRVFWDRAPLRFDPIDNLVSATLLEQVWGAPDGGAAWRRWITGSGFRPPLPAIVAQPALCLLDNRIIAIRVTELVAFFAVIGLIVQIGKTLADARVGLLAAWAFALFPLTQTWCAQGNADPLIWLSLLAVFYILVKLQQPSWRSATLLGVTVGTSLLTRLLVLPYLVGPGLWMLSGAVRNRRKAAWLAGAAVWAFNVCGWWYALQLPHVIANVKMSSAAVSQPYQAEVTPWIYVAPYGFFVCAAAVAWVLARRGRWLSGQTLSLLGWWVAAPVVQFLLLWDVWDRYLLAIVPQCSLLVALALHRLTASWGAPQRARVWWLAALLACLPLAFDMLAQERPWAIDRREFNGLQRALQQVPVGETVVVANDTGVRFYPNGIVLASRYTRHRLVDPYNVEQPFSVGANEPVRYLLHVKLGPRPADGFGLFAESWWDRHGKDMPLLHPLTRTADPNGIVFQLYRLEQARRGRYIPY